MRIVADAVPVVAVDARSPRIGPFGARRSITGNGPVSSKL
jgi:hypothetical protein